MTPKPDPVTCQHCDETNTKRDCEAAAVWRFLIVGVPTFACGPHLPQYAAKTAVKV